ncbi:MAG TPA: sodium ion-translocating decarboxylase subunit beta, partial [Sulfurovum sp.]|nr:sodium ion-translocating decarboxylase subunit beta [Sulfurovum sp.]
MKLKHLLLSILFAFAALTSTVQASAQAATSSAVTEEVEKAYESKSVTELLVSFFETTGLKTMINPKEGVVNGKGEPISIFAQSWGKLIMFAVIFLLFYLAIAKGFEPLLLLPIAFGGLLANIPVANMTGPHGMLGIIYDMGISNEFFPLLIFMGVGAMTDFGPLLSNPKTALLGGAAQFGIFGSLVGAAALSQ